MSIPIESVIAAGFVVSGLVIGFGMLFVKIEQGEVDRLKRFFPGIGIYRYKLTRYIVSLVGFMLVLFGLALMLGWI
jgi:hypothetical protein